MLDALDSIITAARQAQEARRKLIRARHQEKTNG
jgi:hypothetical protein